MPTRTCGRFELPWFSVCAFIIGCCAAGVWPVWAAERPNVIVILTDDQGRADYSHFGTPDVRTPGIDRLFKEGLGFDHFYASSCVCSPTRAALLTGCYPDRVGVPGVIRDKVADSWGYLSPKFPLLPAVLKGAGYHTAIVGKWHLGLEAENHPNARGFDLFHGFLGDMMDDYVTHLRNGHNFMRKNGETINPQGHATDLFTSWACEYVGDRAKAADGKPFFLYLAYNAPHGPIQPPADYLERVKVREPGASPARQKLVALIEHLDAGIGKVLETLDKTGLAQNTLVVFMSDNGGDLGPGANCGPWRAGKGTMYEGGLRVPCAMRWPGKIKPGTTTARLSLTMDLYPTVLELAGAKVPGNIDGVSLAKTLMDPGETGDPERIVYFVRREGNRNYGGKTIEALRKGDWKIVQNTPYTPLELYNLKNDPQEKNELSSKAPKVFNEMTTLLRQQIQRGGAVPWQKGE